MPFVMTTNHMMLRNEIMIVNPNRICAFGGMEQTAGNGGSEGMVSRQRGKEGWVQGGGGEEVGVNKFNGASNHDQRQQQQRRIEI